MGWLATTCWGATTHGKDRAKWEKCHGSGNENSETSAAESKSQKRLKKNATPDVLTNRKTTLASPTLRSSSAMQIQTISAKEQNRSDPLPALRGSDGKQLPPLPILKGGSAYSERPEIHNLSNAEITPQRNLPPPSQQMSPSDADHSEGTANTPPRGALPLPSMIVWANQRQYSSCLKPQQELPTYFVGDISGPHARADNRGEMQRVQCQELCAEKRLVDFRLEEAERAARSQKQLDIRFGKIQELADEHSMLMTDNLHRHDVAQEEKRAALEKAIWRKNRRNLPAIDRCDGEEEERALRVASYLTVIRVVQRFSSFFLSIQQARMMKVLKLLLVPILRLRLARKKRLAKAYASVMLKRTPRPSREQLERWLPAIQEWPLSQVQLLQARIRPYYVPEGQALVHEGEPVSFVFINAYGKLTATQSLSRFKALTGGGDEPQLAGDRARTSSFRKQSLGKSGAGLLGPIQGKGNAKRASTSINLGERTQGSVVGEELVDIKNELNVKAFAAEDAAIYGDAASADASLAEAPKQEAPKTSGLTSSPINRAQCRLQRRQADVAEAKAETEINAYKGWKTPGTATATVVNNVQVALPFPLVLPDFAGGPHRLPKVPVRRHKLRVPCFHGRHSSTLRGSAGGCIGWYVACDQLAELIVTGAALDAAGLGEATGEASLSKAEPSTAAEDAPDPSLSLSRSKSVAKLSRGVGGMLSATLAMASRGTAMDRISHHQLRENRVFELLEPMEAQAMIPNATVHSFIRGQCIYKYNDSESDVYVVAKGVVEIKTRVANANHPVLASYLAQRGLGLDGKPLFMSTHQHNQSAKKVGAGSYQRGRGANSSGLASKAAGADGDSEKDRSRIETRFINVGYCFGEEDAIFSTWRSESAVAATDCVLLKFKGIDIMSALTEKTARYAKLKSIYNEERKKKHTIPPTPQVLNALLAKGDGFEQLIQAAIGKEKQYREVKPVATTQSPATQAASPFASSGAFGPMVSVTTPGGHAGSAQPSPASPTKVGGANTSNVWPFIALVGGGKKIDEPSSADLLQELLAGKGPQAMSGSSTRFNSNGGSAFALGGLNFRRTNTYQQHFVTVILARSSLSHLCSVIYGDCLKALVHRHSAVSLDSMGMVGVLESATSPVQSITSGPSRALTNGGGTDGKKKRLNSPNAKVTAATLLSMTSPQPTKAPRISATDPSSLPSAITQHPFLFSSFFTSAMRPEVLSAGALLPSGTSIIYLQRGVVEVSADSVALGANGRVVFGRPGAIKIPIQNECVVIAAPALIFSASAFKYTKEQFVRALASGTIDLVQEHKESLGTVVARAALRDNGPPVEAPVTRQSLLEEGLKLGILHEQQPAEGQPAPSTSTAATSNTNAVASAKGARKDPSTKPAIPLPNAQPKDREPATKEKDAQAKDKEHFVCAKLPSAPSIVFKTVAAVTTDPLSLEYQKSVAPAMGNSAPQDLGASVGPKQQEQIRQYELLIQAEGELSALAEELASHAAGCQKIIAKTRCSLWHVYYIDAIRRFSKVAPADILKAMSVAATHASSAASVEGSGATNFNHLPMDVVEFFSEPNLGAEAELPELLDKSGVFLLK